MSYLILIDEPALKECVESNTYQSRAFEAGESLAKALGGDRSVEKISPRLTLIWHKECLYLLQVRGETGYLVIDSKVFESIPPESEKGSHNDDVLLVFQRLCRFALKEWNNLSFSFSEMWSAKTGCGVVFPYPKSKHIGFRATLKKPPEDRRLSIRYGTKQLFAFASGLDEEDDSTAEQDRAYRKALEELGPLKLDLEPTIRRIEAEPSDRGYRPLVLSDTNHSHIKFQQYDEWVRRLTKEQKAFVTANLDRPQRVEGAAGTGKTLCLLLRAFHLCKTAENDNTEFRVLFVSHSEATRNSIQIAFDCLGDPAYHQRNRRTSPQTIELRTLQEWCGAVLGEKEVSNAQYLDQDALQSKELRKMLIKDVVEGKVKSEQKALEYLSPECRSFFETENVDYIAELLQHEVGVMIKGRAAESLESYIGLPLLAYCLPAKSERDRRFIFALYKEYQQQLNQSGAFDTDDIVLSTLGRLNTPIWRRRRITEGFDAILIDETHLFNFNELSVFHHLLRNSEKPRIIFSIDRSQAPGERGITSGLVREVLTQSSDAEAETRTQVVFRSSPAIVRLAEAITSAAATLFTTFENPLIDTSSVISASDEELAQETVYWKCSNDVTMCALAANRARVLGQKLKCPPSDVLLVAMNEQLLPQLCESLDRLDLKWVQILNRGDLKVVHRGEREGAFIVSHPDYVGGLEFKAVLIVGVDEGRVPPSDGTVTNESRHFVEFKSCNRLYVSLSRARLAVELFYSAQRGPSPLLAFARSSGAILEKSSEQA